MIDYSKLTRRFIFIGSGTDANEINSCIAYLNENNPEAIVFIEPTRQIWTHGVYFDSSNIKEYIDNTHGGTIQDLTDLEERINAAIQELKNSLPEKKEEFYEDLQDAVKSL